MQLAEAMPADLLPAAIGPSPDSRSSFKRPVDPFEGRLAEAVATLDAAPEPVPFAALSSDPEIADTLARTLLVRELAAECTPGCLRPTLGGVRFATAILRQAGDSRFSLHARFAGRHGFALPLPSRPLAASRPAIMRVDPFAVALNAVPPVIFRPFIFGGIGAVVGAVAVAHLLLPALAAAGAFPGCFAGIFVGEHLCRWWSSTGFRAGAS